jgi:hypothetical protein
MSGALASNASPRREALFIAAGEISAMPDALRVFVSKSLRKPVQTR